MLTAFLFRCIIIFFILAAAGFPTTFAGGAEELAGTAMPVASIDFSADTAIAKMLSWALSGTIAYNLSQLSASTKIPHPMHLRSWKLNLYFPPVQGHKLDHTSTRLQRTR
jgi:hypothetical protein